MSVEKSEFRKALGTFLTGVTVVTTVDGAGEPWGVTANSFTSVSLDPPIILVCLGRQGRAWPAFGIAERFAVNILAADQHTLATHFAGRTQNRFTGIDWIHQNDAALLPGVAAWLDCRVRERIGAGDHAILLGDVRAFDHSPRPSLGYHRGGFAATRPMETIHA